MIQCDSCEERFKAPTFYIMVIWAVKFKNEGQKISYIFYQKSILTVITYCILWIDIVLGHQKLGIILEKLMLAENVKSEKWAPKFILLKRYIQIILEKENWLWKSEFCLEAIKSCIPLPLKLYHPYYHILHTALPINTWKPAPRLHGQRAIYLWSVPASIYNQSEFCSSQRSGNYRRKFWSL